MGDRFYTSITVSGPNAITAEKAAIGAIKALDWYKTSTAWVEEGMPFGPCIYDKCSGEVAVDTIAKVSRQFTTETFELFVDGGHGEGIQGLVIIHDGQVEDGRSEASAYGETEEENRQLAVGDKVTFYFQRVPIGECTVTQIGGEIDGEDYTGYAVLSDDPGARGWSIKVEDIILPYDKADWCVGLVVSKSSSRIGYNTEWRPVSKERERSCWDSIKVMPEHIEDIPF